MTAHIQGVLTAITNLGFPATFVDVPLGTPYPYAFMWGPVPGETSEPSLEGDDPRVDFPFFVTTVALDPLAVVGAAQEVRAGLVADGAVIVAGFNTRVVYRGTEIVSVDRKITVPESDSHPSFAVESFHLYSSSS